MRPLHRTRAARAQLQSVEQDTIKAKFIVSLDGARTNELRNERKRRRDNEACTVEHDSV